MSDIIPAEISAEWRKTVKKLKETGYDLSKIKIVGREKGIICVETNTKG